MRCLSVIGAELVATVPGHSHLTDALGCLSCRSEAILKLIKHEN